MAPLMPHCGQGQVHCCPGIVAVARVGRGAADGRKSRHDLIQVSCLIGLFIPGGAGLCRRRGIFLDNTVDMRQGLVNTGNTLVLLLAFLGNIGHQLHDQLRMRDDIVDGLGCDRDRLFPLFYARDRFGDKLPDLLRGIGTALRQLAHF